MMEIATIEKALNHLARPAEVLKMRVAAGQDATGEEAIWVWMVVPPGVATDPTVLDKLLQLKGNVREQLAKLAPGVWPYIRIENPGDTAEQAKSP
jgi:hypothetical protein